VELLEKN
jgi:hypothetical protein